jgi:hypothetical protein
MNSNNKIRGRGNRKFRGRRRVIRNNNNRGRRLRNRIGNNIRLNRNRRNNFNNRKNNQNNNNKNLTNKLDKELKTLTKYVKNFSLGGGPLKSFSSKQKKNTNDPNTIKREIRYDKLYNAFEMYNMGKYYSFYKTSNMIVRLAIYSSHSFVIPTNAENCGFLWFPYFYPRQNVTGHVRTQNENKAVDNMSNFFLRIGTEITLFRPTPTDVRGNYRLISATMKIANTTTNSDKGGSYTVYRITRNDGQPVFYNTQLGLTTTQYPIDVNLSLIGGLYNNEPVKYLYNANQSALCNEYGVLDGNNIFQSYYEYLGQMTNEATTFYTLCAGGSKGSGEEFNPQGVNVKYIAQFDPVSKDQTYKVECVQIFEVSPLSTDTISALAFKGNKSVYPSVITQAKNKFNLEVAPL